MAEGFNVGERVKVCLDSAFWSASGWHAGTLVRIQPYSRHRNFYWVELDVEVSPAQGGSTRLISVLNPKMIARL